MNILNYSLDDIQSNFKTILDQAYANQLEYTKQLLLDQPYISLSFIERLLSHEDISIEDKVIYNNKTQYFTKHELYIILSRDIPNDRCIFLPDNNYICMSKDTYDYLYKKYYH